MSNAMKKMKNAKKEKKQKKTTQQPRTAASNGNITVNVQSAIGLHASGFCA